MTYTVYADAVDGLAYAMRAQMTLDRAQDFAKRLSELGLVVTVQETYDDQLVQEWREGVRQP